MNRRVFLGAAAGGLAAAAGGCAGGGVGRDPETVRILSYNLHHSEGVDGKIDLERIARVVRDSGADVVALQEIDVGATRTGRVDQAAEYMRLTGLSGHFGKAIDFQGGAYGQLLLSRWPLAGFEVHRLPNPSRREQRLALSARITTPRGQSFRFVGLHLDATREDGDRFLQAEALDGLFGGDDLPTVLAGDFNAVPESRVMGRLLGKWADASASNPMPTIPAEKPDARIDFVLCRPVGRWRVVESRVIAEAVASDHRPLLVTLAMETAPHGAGVLAASAAPGRP